MAKVPRVTCERDGVWSARVYLGTATDGRRIRPYKRFTEAKSREQAQELAQAWANDLTANGKVTSVLMRDVMDAHIASLAKEGASPHTVRTYKLYAERYVNPRLGHRMAKDVSPVDIEKLQAFLLEQGGKDRSQLSSETVRGVRKMLSGLFKWLMCIDVVEENPVSLARTLKAEGHEAHALSSHDLRLLDDALRAYKGSTDPVVCSYARGVWTALKTGLRVGEVCALRVGDVRVLSQEVHVGGTVVEIGGTWRKSSPKSDKSTRNVALTTADFQEVCSWRGHNAASPLISADGSWMRPSGLSGWFRELRDRLGLDSELTFHSLRHTYATTLLMAGADPKSVSEQMGHSDVAITLRIYGHVIPGRGAQLASMASDAYDQMTRG